MTHQDIIDRMEALGREYGAAYRAEQARISKEKESLQELCGGIGHFFATPQTLHFEQGRQCVFCRKSEA